VANIIRRAVLRRYQGDQEEAGRRPVSGMSLKLDDHPSADDLRQILDGVRAYNQAAIGNERPRAVACFLRDDEGRIMGGAQADLWGRSMHLAAMWVAEAQRGKGYGSALLRGVEDYSASHGCRLAYLETTNFQARPFYERLGYQVFGELVGIDDDCTLFFLRKDLKPSERAANLNDRK
jgi:GNAT superfamily N-acetyltransferase